ncbi:hypothetical protein JT359_14360 [Candidatus Poribacteria bacterium]|nr:hypothetical protein [Candidatus Poribacteria bacterium]
MYLLTFVGLLFTFNAAIYADVSHVTTQEGITVTFKLPQLQVSRITPDGNNGITQDNTAYDTVHYSDCHWIQEPGYPKLPVTRLLLAIPPDIKLNNTDISVHTGFLQTRNGVKLPVDKELQPTHNNLYPSVLARIEMDGYIRSQRVITLALHPVQYNIQNRVLQSYTSLTVSIPFQSQQSKLGKGTRLNSILSNTQEHLNSNKHSLTHNIHNYSEYKKIFNTGFQANTPSYIQNGNIPSAPAAPGIDPSNQTRYKLYIDQTGIYSVSAASLHTDWDIDIIGVDPQRIHLSHADQEIPIHISGADDGSFDAEDAIFFLAHGTTDPDSPYTKNAYTLWNVYWLTVSSGAQLPTRIPQIDVSPSDATAVQVPTFRSRVIFEEDHLTNNLEFVDPDVVSDGDKHKWFDALDFWYWDGIKNASDIGELRHEFLLHDIAKSFDAPEIHVVLQGGTPAPHEILASVNGVKIDLAKWDLQSQITLSRNLRVWNNLKDASQGENNILSLTRVDSTFEEDTKRYPYHIYLNRFWVDYTRLFLAVDDELRFGTPIKTMGEEEKKGRIHQFRVDAFLDPQITIFETDGNTLTAKLQGVDIQRQIVNDEMRNRLKTLNSGDVRGVPNNTYSAIFQIPDTRTTEFIAVSNSAIRKPAKIETIQPSELRNTLNGVDYLILTHATYREQADRLANWRSTPQGGGHRTKVVDINDVYNTFGDGRVHPIWIKNFLTYAYHNWTPPALLYMVILGDGTFDFRGIDKDIYSEPPELTGYIPTHYITTDSFGRTSTDHWYATVSGHDEFVDFYLGRITIETEDEANAVIDKIINYESNRPNGAWRRRIISVADDEVNNPGDHIFKKSLNEIAKNHTRLGYETIEIYLEDVIDEVEANPDQFPGSLPRHVAKDRIINALGEGAAIAQYAGHGGRIVWAHEAIFGNASVDKVKETGHLPFMLVLSCYNGYFDEPGEPSMAEKLLRKERGGIMGMLSATRLTYGSGNEDLNQIIFDMLFQRNIRQLGPLSFDSKLEYLLTQGTGQLDIMLEYTLFGDPAMYIAMADYEILPAIQTKTVKAGDTLKISPGYIQTASYDPITKKKEFTRNTNFNGELTVKFVFPGEQSFGVDKTGAPKEFYSGDVIKTKTLTVTKGSYPAVEIDVPDNIAAGDAHVEYYAENDTEIAIGGDGFTVKIPKILDIKPILNANSSGDDVIDIFVHVSDDEGAVDSVKLEWRNPRTANWEIISLIPTQSAPEPNSPKIVTARWWKIPEVIPVPTDGSALRYDIQVTDTEGNSVRSEILRFYPYTYPNLSVAASREENITQINYQLGNPEDRKQEHVLSVDIELAGTANSSDKIDSENDLLSVLGLSDVNIDVAFFSGNPDLDDNGIVDENAHLIGKTQITPKNWVVRNPQNNRSDAYIPNPLNINPIATVTIPTSLRTGIHDVFVYVDPLFNESDENGEVLENNENDNIGYRQLTVSSNIIGEVPTRVGSIDGGLRINVPAGVIQNKTTILNISSIVQETSYGDEDYAIGGTGKARDIPVKTKPIFPSVGNDEKNHLQAGTLIPVTFPNHPSMLGYTLEINDAESDNASNSFKLQTPVSIELDFDFSALQHEIIRELFGSDIDVTNEMPAIEETVNTAIEARSRNLGAYLWLETIANWTKLDSNVKKNPNGSIFTTTRATGIRAINSSDAVLNDVIIPSDGVDTGIWILLFDTTHTCRLLFLPDQLSEENLINKPEIKEIAKGIPITSFTSKFGVSIENIPDFTLEIQEGDIPFQFGDIMRFRIARIEAPGEEVIQLFASSFTTRNTGNGTIQYLDLSTDTTIPQDSWLILFVSENQYQIEGENTGILQNNGVPVYGTVGKPYEHKDYGINLLITHGTTPFTPGDRFIFDTSPVGTIQANTSYLGTITCLQSEDTVPPNIQLTIGNQEHFVSGDPVNASPLIQATLTDPRGIDYITRPVRLELGKLGEFQPIAETEYNLTQHPGSSQLVLTYNSPELEPREYQLRLIASDLDGNTGESEIAFQVHGKLQLVEPLNYPNPFKSDTTVTCELTRPAESLTVKIYTLTGRLIRELQTEASAGFIQLKWDGKDDDGNEVANGVYYGKMIVKSLEDENDQTHILKMMKLK